MYAFATSSAAAAVDKSYGARSADVRMAECRDSVDRCPGGSHRHCITCYLAGPFAVSALAITSLI
jgi:hypothetical protein